MYAHAICGVDQLPDYGGQGVTHVLSLLDPAWPAIDAFDGFAEHRRTILSFHDIIDPAAGKEMPGRQHVEAVLRLGQDLAVAGGEIHLLVHCHMGVSRSTAAMLTILAQARPDKPESELFSHLRDIRPQAWPNSVLVGLADEMLDRKGRLVDGLRDHYARQLAAEPKYRDWMTRLGREREVEMGEGRG